MKKILLSLATLLTIMSANAVVGYSYTLQVSVPAGTAQVYANGSFNGWTFQALTNIGGDLWQLTGITSTEQSIQYSYACAQDWAYVEDYFGTHTLNYSPGSTATSNDIVSAWTNTPEPSGTGESALSPTKFAFAPHAFSITFEGSAAVEVYTAAGALIDATIATGTYTKGNLQVGVYIVKIDGIAKRIIIKN